MPTPDNTPQSAGYAGGYFGVDSGFCARGDVLEICRFCEFGKVLELESNLKPIDFKLLLD
ncbi:hypothetical protein NDQ70_12030 [Neisseria gonorrhoeae]|uniref:hypothetical protein n=1 Tax=Neisseria gonorrhoeae TaxID=485 RepID=UPI0021E4ED44|nr:hypothetical protein [Neisseria gonorrhoeae]UXX20348.1 hypothetical protein NDQ70_12030 [Neisseria gonorrhoeae]